MRFLSARRLAHVWTSPIDFLWNLFAERCAAKRISHKKSPMCEQSLRQMKSKQMICIVQFGFMRTIFFLLYSMKNIRHIYCHLPCETSCIRHFLLCSHAGFLQSVSCPLELPIPTSFVLLCQTLGETYLLREAYPTSQLHFILPNNSSPNSYYLLYHISLSQAEPSNSLV